jgi:hypothetical protein
MKEEEERERGSAGERMLQIQNLKFGKFAEEIERR